MARRPADVPWPLLLCDLADSQSLEQVLARAYAEYEGIEALVNKAGTYFAHSWHEENLAEFRSTMAVNTEAVFLACQAFARHRIALGRPGSIVNISSVSARIGSVDQAYAVSKGVMDALTKSFARALANAGIRLNAVAPGPINTAMGARIPDQRQQEDMRTILQARFGEPEEIATMLEFLASDQASLITGEIVYCTGGIL